MNQLEQLKKLTTVVADTGDIDSIRQYTPTDATTNPSLIYQAAKQPQYLELVKKAVYEAKKVSVPENERLGYLLDRLSVHFGLEILKTVPGRVSTEVDARLSFDTEATLHKARQLITHYREASIPKERILIKIASTWEGIQAASILQKEGICCNLTLLFSFAQALACAEAKVTLISPFVGRILDWYKTKNTTADYAGSKDPGVQSVTKIYQYYKKFDCPTVVMGASFRNIGEIQELAGCDLLTISPKLLEELKNNPEPLQGRLNADQSKGLDLQRIECNEKYFRWEMNEDACATEKLAEGIRNFTKDLRELECFVKPMLG